MEGPISFWGYKEQESNVIFPEHDDDDDDEFWEKRSFVCTLVELQFFWQKFDGK
jgi:hypothetical protein